MFLNKGLRRFIPVAIIVGFFAAMPSIGRADTITFNLEGLASGTFASIIDTQSGLTMSVHRVDNANFTIENPRFSPSDFGSRTLGNFLGPFVTPGAALIINFSSAITGGSVSFGDYNVDDDGMVTLTAFSGLDGGGSTLGTSSVAYPADLDIDNRFSFGGNAAIRTLTVNAAGIQSLTILGGGPFPNTLFFDNIVAVTTPTPAPEPASVALLGSGLLVLAVSGRLSRRK